MIHQQGATSARAGPSRRFPGTRISKSLAPTLAPVSPPSNVLYPLRTVQPGAGSRYYPMQMSTEQYLSIMIAIMSVP